jgi:hypothetical protein
MTMVIEYATVTESEYTAAVYTVTLRHAEKKGVVKRGSVRCDAWTHTAAISSHCALTALGLCFKIV